MLGAKWSESREKNWKLIWVIVGQASRNCGFRNWPEINWNLSILMCPISPSEQSPHACLDWLQHRHYFWIPPCNLNLFSALFSIYISTDEQRPLVKHLLCCPWWKNKVLLRLWRQRAEQADLPASKMTDAPCICSGMVDVSPVIILLHL